MIEVFNTPKDIDLTLFISVYNEEKRIENFLKSFKWLKNIVVIDKQSSDLTVNICLKYGVDVVNLPFSEPYDGSFIDQIVNKYCRTSWVIFPTASDIIHPNLSLELIRIFESGELSKYDIIKVPFQTYILGLNSNRSPWHTQSKAYIFRKETYFINAEGVHNGIQLNSKKILNLNCDYPIFHLTHESVDSMMSRHMSYWKGEATLPTEIDLNISFRLVLRKFFKILLKDRTYLNGYDGIMLSFTYISYFMLSFVYQWERKKSNASMVYREIREKIISEIENQ
jgi:hypothetical protein